MKEGIPGPRHSGAVPWQELLVFGRRSGPGVAGLQEAHPGFRRSWCHGARQCVTRGRLRCGEGEEWRREAFQAPGMEPKGLEVRNRGEGE